MNQVIEWTGSCQRCYTTTNMHIMSMFDVSLICMECADAERNHPQYSQASEAESTEVKSGNRNFKGIGVPTELTPGMEWELTDEV